MGVLLYSVIPLGYITGTYRLLNFKNFYKKIGSGLLFDFLCSGLAMLVTQIVNN